MADQTKIAAVLDRLDEAFSHIAKIVDAKDLDKRKQLIAFRRALSDCLIDLNQAIESASLAGRLDANWVNEYRLRAAAFRRAMALHQAEWPVILIADDMTNYVVASQALRRKRDAFISWMRFQFLPHIRPC